MKKVGAKRLSASRGSASTLDTRLEKERKMNTPTTYYFTALVLKNLHLDVPTHQL